MESRDKGKMDKGKMDKEKKVRVKKDKVTKVEIKVLLVKRVRAEKERRMVMMVKMEKEVQKLLWRYTKSKLNLEKHCKRS
ncbi:hypothetical protein D3C72_2145510 [compost metagenome]